MERSNILDKFTYDPSVVGTVQIQQHIALYKDFNW